VNLSHFSIYALASINTSEEDLSKAYAYPNPYKPGTGGVFDSSSLGDGVVFDKLTEKAVIRIYTLSGEFVAELNESDGDGRYLWNVRNQDGDKVASGVYLYLINNPDKGSDKAKGKLVIIK
jgi:hypothetical protein